MPVPLASATTYFENTILILLFFPAQQDQLDQSWAVLIGYTCG